MASYSKAADKVGLPPGTLIYINDADADPISVDRSETVRVFAIDYAEGGFTEVPYESPAGLADFKTKESVTWIHVSGLWDVDLIRSFGEVFNIHGLTLEDIVHVGQRPKAENYDDYLYIVLHRLFFDEKAKTVRKEQISIVLFDRLLLSFSESTDPIFGNVERRIKNDGRIRKYGCDYLAYALMDTIVDDYFVVMEHLEEILYEYESRLIDDPQSGSIEEIKSMRCELFVASRSIRPAFAAADTLVKIDSPLIKKSTRVYFRDIYDHVARICDSVDADRETLSGIFDLYNSGINLRMNEIMKVLTIMSTIFIPLTFIAGIYGMNFENIPELSWPYAYQACLIVMLLIVAAMFLWFRRKKWI